MEATLEKADELTTEEQADKIIRNYSIGSAAPSLIPAPLVDLVAVTALQAKMIHSLTKLYGVEYKEEVARSAISALIGGTASIATARLVSSAVKAVPIVGPLVGWATQPVLSSATTYGVGKTFVMHFESGGTLLTFDPTKVSEYFVEAVKNGKKVASANKAKKQD